MLNDSVRFYSARIFKIQDDNRLFAAVSKWPEDGTNDCRYSSRKQNGCRPISGITRLMRNCTKYRYAVYVATYMSFDGRRNACCELPALRLCTSWRQRSFPTKESVVPATNGAGKNFAAFNGSKVRLTVRCIRKVHNCILLFSHGTISWTLESLCKTQTLLFRITKERLQKCKDYESYFLRPMCREMTQARLKQGVNNKGHGLKKLSNFIGSSDEFAVKRSDTMK